MWKVWESLIDTSLPLHIDDASSARVLYKWCFLIVTTLRTSSDFFSSSIRWALCLCQVRFWTAFCFGCAMADLLSLCCNASLTFWETLSSMWQISEWKGGLGNRSICGWCHFSTATALCNQSLLQNDMNKISLRLEKNLGFGSSDSFVKGGPSWWWSQ